MLFFLLTRDNFLEATFLVHEAWYCMVRYSEEIKKYLVTKPFRSGSFRRQGHSWRQLYKAIKSLAITKHNFCFCLRWDHDHKGFQNAHWIQRWILSMQDIAFMFVGLLWECSPSLHAAFPPSPAFYLFQSSCISKEQWHLTGIYREGAKLWQAASVSLSYKKNKLGTEYSHGLSKCLY